MKPCGRCQSSDGAAWWISLTFVGRRSDDSRTGEPTHLDFLPVVSDDFEAMSLVETNGGFIFRSDFQLQRGALGVCDFDDLADEPIANTTARLCGDVAEDPCLRGAGLVEMPGT